MVGFCGSRALPVSAADTALVSGVVSSVLAGVPRRGVAVGCAVGADALVVSSVLALGASSRPRVFAAFGPVSPPASLHAARVFAPGASSSISSVSGVADALAAGASVSWWAGAVPQSTWQPASPTAPRPSSRRSPPPVLGAASSGSSPRPARPASVPLLPLRPASQAPARARGLPSRSPQASDSPLSSSPSGRWPQPAPQTRSPPHGVRGLHWHRLDLAPPGRVGSASCPNLHTSSAARRGPHTAT
jgi:hypothetical protein